jgi:hypothetical protein
MTSLKMKLLGRTTKHGGISPMRKNIPMSWAISLQTLSNDLLRQVHLAPVAPRNGGRGVLQGLFNEMAPFSMTFSNYLATMTLHCGGSAVGYGCSFYWPSCSDNFNSLVQRKTSSSTYFRRLRHVMSCEQPSCAPRYAVGFISRQN